MKRKPFENIFAEFEKAHPEIDVQLDFRPWDTYWDMINVNMSGGMLPDIVSVSTQLGSKYYIPGVFEDLAPYIERDEVKTEEFAQNVMDAFTMDGKVLAFLMIYLCIHCATIKHCWMRVVLHIRHRIIP